MVNDRLNIYKKFNDKIKNVNTTIMLTLKELKNIEAKNDFKSK